MVCAFCSREYNLLLSSSKSVEHYLIGSRQIFFYSFLDFCPGVQLGVVSSSMAQNGICLNKKSFSSSAHSDATANHTGGYSGIVVLMI